MNSLKRAGKSFAIRVRFWLSARNSILFKAFYSHFYSPKPRSISYFIDKYSRENPGLTVVQVGANDGMLHDPIHKFIKRDNWQGILLEPQKYVFNKFLEPLYRRNKGITPVNCALGETDGTITLYKISFSNKRWATGLASFDRQSIVNSFESGYAFEQAKKNKEVVPDKMEDRITSEEVMVFSPSTLLQEHAIDQIDFLQVDAEGFDFEVIKLFDIANTQPGVISYESSHFSDETLQECNDLLIENDYKIRTIGRNSIAMKKPLGSFEEYFNSTD